MKTVVYSILGTQLDMGKQQNRWNRWRPNISIFQQDDFAVDRIHLIYAPRYKTLADQVTEDIALLSPKTEIVRENERFSNPWDFEEVYGRLLDLIEANSFDPENEEYLFHITTGTHVAQICIFLLTESRRFPGKLLQTHPSRNGNDPKGSISIVDLDLSRYDRIASRFLKEAHDDIAFLKSGIETKNRQFNELIELIERVAIRSSEPILLTGATGAGKSRLARQIYALKKQRNNIKGDFVELNCATLRGDSAMSALFGHIKGAYTGAVQNRQGFLAKADQGMIFLDEIGELGPDEQAMLLHAIEEKRFFSVGADHESTSDFQIICGTNRDLAEAVHSGRFREDLLARINLWTFDLPGLRDRPQDILPNLEYELALFEKNTGKRVTFNKEALGRFLDFAQSPESLWKGNFRDLKASVIRMCTLARGARISLEDVEAETQRLRSSWYPIERKRESGTGSFASQFPGLDEFDLIQLEGVLRICREHKTLAEAGRRLFAQSRLKRDSVNDSDRLKKYLAKFGLIWENIPGIYF